MECALTFCGVYIFSSSVSKLVSRIKSILTEGDVLLTNVVTSAIVIVEVQLHIFINQTFFTGA